MTQIIYDDGRSNKIPQIVLSRGEVAGNEMARLRAAGTIREVIEFYSGDWYLCKMDDFDDKTVQDILIRIRVQSNKKETRMRQVFEQIKAVKQLLGRPV